MPYSDLLSLRLQLLVLTKPPTISRRLILQQARGHLTLPQIVSLRFHILFHSPPEDLFSPFPHGTVSLSVIQEYLALQGGPCIFARNFTCFMLLDQNYNQNIFLQLRDFNPLWYRISLLRLK